MSMNNSSDRKIIHEETVVDNRQQPVVQQVPAVPVQPVQQVVTPAEQIITPAQQVVTPAGQVVTQAPTVQPVVTTRVVQPAAPSVQEQRTVDVVEDPVAGRLNALDQISRVIYFLFTILAILLAFRFVLKLLAANPDSGFGSFIYNVTWPFAAPFIGVLGQPTVPQTGSVVEFPTLLAIAVYALIAWGLVKLLWLIFDHGDNGRSVTTTINRKQRL